MQTITIALGSETTGQVFPAAIQSRDWVGYHGTASAYSARIEREGFLRSNRPIADEDIDFVAEVAARRNADPDGKVAGFKNLGSISFSSSPLVALSYAAPGQGGGQGVGYVHSVARSLIDQHGQSLSADELSRLESLVSRIEAIRQSQPVIYAFDLQGLELARFQNATAAIHVYSDIPPERILAKALVPAGMNHAAIDGRTLRDTIRHAYGARLGNWFCAVPRG